jgi:hypothetical protein
MILFENTDNRINNTSISIINIIINTIAKSPIEKVGVAMSFLMNSRRFSSSSKLDKDPVELSVPCDRVSPGTESLPVSSQAVTNFALKICRLF